MTLTNAQKPCKHPVLQGFCSFILRGPFFEKILTVFKNKPNFVKKLIKMERITISPLVCKGKPSIRNMRFTVSQMLELLASGMSHEEILSDYPFLENADILACLTYASLISKTKNIYPLSTAA